MDVLGIDEAGRGPVLGPLVVAGIVIPEEKNTILERMGVKDSKRLTPNRRKVLARKLKNMFEYETVSISASDIDNLREKGFNLNEIERMAMVKVIEKLNFDKAILDSVDIKPDRFVRDIKEVVGDLDISAEHKADDNYIQVAAASIIAKYNRDEAISEINKDYRKIGGIGSGYPSDPTTKEFLTNFTYDEMPDFVRKSWATVEKLK
ncbi:ribonuclease HII [Methanobrevibacter sp. OttesenSCG-928-K11]|nr:ribonuclease HII [Methanobrevibacter sp. OttesenSCG-928-K11]